MARPVDMTKKIEDLRNTLQKYNGIPSQTVDRAAHANIKYYIKTHSDLPEIQELIEKYNLSFSKRVDYDTHLENVKQILADHGRMPSSSTEKTIYQNVKAFFKKYKDIPEVEKLIYVYAFGCFPLANTKFGERPDTNWDIDYGADPEWYRWRKNVSYEYIAYVYNKYGVLPGENTKPMIVLKNQINHFQRYNVDLGADESKALYDFLKLMVESGCKDDLIYGNYYCYQFCEESIQQRVRRTLIRNGACSIGYIARRVIEGVHLPERFVFYYYYVQQNDKENFWDIAPLGNLYKHGTFAPEVLLVHYRDAEQCPIESIRENAMKYYRDWETEPPVSMEEWRAYGQWFFFVHNKEWNDVTNEYDIDTDWTHTIVSDALNKGIPYFRFYRESKYLDYCLFLLEKGYTPDQSELLKPLAFTLSREREIKEAEDIRNKTMELLREKNLL